MLRKWNRFLAFLLAFALVTTTFGSDFASAKVYAVEGIEDAEPDEVVEPEEPEEPEAPVEGDGISSLSFAEETPAEVVEEETDTVTPEVVDETAAPAEPVTEAAPTNETAPATEAVATPATDAVAAPAESSTETAKAAEEETPVEEEKKEIIEETPEEEEPAEEDEVEEKLVTVTYKATDGGSVTVDSEEIDVNAEDAAFEGSEAQADEGYVFINWTDADGEEVSTDAKFVPDLLEENAEFTAVFEAAETEEDESDAIVVTYVAGEGGTVSVEKETLDPDDEEAKLEGSTATADEGFKFVAWVDENDETVSEDATFVPSDITESATFKATFEAVPVEKIVKVTYKVTKGGRLTKYLEKVDVNNPEAKFEGSEAIALFKEYTFDNWTDENGEVVSEESLFVPSDITEDAVFTANFKASDDIEVTMPALSVPNIHEGGLVVSVDAEVGTFPLGTEVSVSAISDDQAVATAEKALGEGNVSAAKGVDISFIYEGESIQPADEKMFT